MEQDPGHLLPQENWDAVEKEAARIVKQQDLQKEVEDSAGRQHASYLRLRSE